MAQHVKALAVLNICLGAFGVLGAIIVFAVFGGVAGLLTFVNLDRDAQFVVPLIGLVGGFVSLIVALVSIPSIVAGVGLLYFQNWARILMIVLSALNIFHFPFGTALGIYGLWVLLANETQPLFNRPMNYVPMRS